jgi:hypothetical protein
MRVQKTSDPERLMRQGPQASRSKFLCIAFVHFAQRCIVHKTRNGFLIGLHQFPTNRPETNLRALLRSLAMRRVGTDGDGAGASKKLRVSESEIVNEHVVSMMQMVGGA